MITTSGRSSLTESLRFNDIELRVLRDVKVVKLLWVRDGLRGVFSLRLEVLGGEAEVEVEGSPIGRRDVLYGDSGTETKTFDLRREREIGLVIAC